jgi:collagenase-like PrtC family protease
VKTPKLIAPVEKEEMILPAKRAGADIVYVDYTNFIKNGHFKKTLLFNFIKIAHSIDLPVYLYFGQNILESHLKLIENLIDDLSVINIDGIMVNDFSVTEIIKNKKIKKLKYNIHLDSGLNIHNTAGCKLFESWKAKSISVTEELYLKNVTRIKKYAGRNISISINEAIWLLGQTINLGIELFKIEGNYDNAQELYTLIYNINEIIKDIQTDRRIDNIKIEAILDLLDHSRPQKLYRTDHFTRKFKDLSGNNFEFKGNIKFFNWNTRKVSHPLVKFNPQKLNKQNTQLRLRLTKLEHITALKEYVNQTGINPVDIIEYGEIINTTNLSNKSYKDIINEVKQICIDLGLQLYLTTPKILIERDFDRVVETMKTLVSADSSLDAIVVNNLGLWQVIKNIPELKKLKLEIGYGLEIYNSTSVRFFENIADVDGINIKNIFEPDYISKMNKNLTEKRKNMVIMGPVRLETSGLCPLNNDLAVVSRLECKAPCQKHSYAVVDPATGEMYPVILDGFCRFHLVYSYLEDLLAEKNKYIEAGITDFTIDFTALPEDMIRPLLDRYVLAFTDLSQYSPIKPEPILYKSKIHQSPAL